MVRHTVGISPAQENGSKGAGCRQIRPTKRPRRQPMRLRRGWGSVPVDSRLRGGHDGSGSGAGVLPAAARSDGGDEGVSSSKGGEEPIKGEVEARADVAEPDRPMWCDLLVHQFAGQAGPAWVICNIYTIGKLGSTPTKFETNPKPDEDYTDENRGNHAKRASNRYVTKPHYEVAANSDLDLTKLD